MRRPTLLPALVALAVASAVGAAVIPAGAYASRISVAESFATIGASEISVDVGRHVVVVHAPEGLVVRGTDEREPPPRVDVFLVPTFGRNQLRVSFIAGPGPRPGRRIGEAAGRPIYVVSQGNGVEWEVVPGATVVVVAQDASLGELLEVIDLLEIDPDR
jgi:hypothetical protein